MVEVLAKQYKEVFVHNVLHGNFLTKKLENLRRVRKIEIRHLKEVIPIKRKEMRERIFELSKKSKMYFDQGKYRLYEKYMNQASRENLKAWSRYNSMKVIHMINRDIREIKARIEQDNQSQESNKYCLKETLYQDFINQYIQ